MLIGHCRNARFVDFISQTLLWMTKKNWPLQIQTFQRSSSNFLKMLNELRCYLFFFINLSSSYSQSACTFSQSSPLHTPPRLPPSCSSHSLTPSLLHPRGSAVWLLQEPWLISGQVPQVLPLLHLVRLLSQLSFSFTALQDDTLSLPLSSFFCHLPHLLSCSSSLSLAAIYVLSLRVSFVLWLMRSVANINLNQVIRDH